jgi:toxin ParE1/3/4
MARVTQRAAARRDLAQQPRVGAPLTLKHRDLASMRKWRIKDFANHLVFYEPRPDGVVIVRVLHAASDGWGLLGMA